MNSIPIHSTKFDPGRNRAVRRQTCHVPGGCAPLARAIGQHHHKRRGGTLVEVMISALIVGVLIVPTLRMLGAVATSYSRRGNQDLAQELAEDLLSEIMQARFADPDINLRAFGPETNESTVNRSQFDDVDDYHLRVEQPPQRKDGTPLNDYSAFRREVAVTYVDPANPGIVSYSPTALKRIQVLVTHNGQAAAVHGLRAATGVFEIEPGTAAIGVRRIGIDLGLDTTNSPLVTGSEILNQFPAAE